MFNVSPRSLHRIVWAKVAWVNGGVVGCRATMGYRTRRRGGSAAMKFLNRVVWTTAIDGSISKRPFHVNAIRRLSTTQCRDIAVQAQASAPLHARSLQRSVLPGPSQTTDELWPQTGRV